MDSSKVTFDGIRESIVEYLSSNPTFKDYNFTAPAISALIDALAYTSHYLIRYANFTLNECFLDSAQLRYNVVSNAKKVSYIPYQYSAAKAKLNLKITNTELDIPDGTKIPQDTLFTAVSSSGSSFLFRTLDQYILRKDDSGYYNADIDVIEGTWVTEKFTQDENYTSRFFLLNNKIDTNYLKVIVYELSTSTEGTEYIQAKDVSSFGPDSTIFYLQEAYNGQIEIYFGDGVLSKKLQPFNSIEVKYLVTNGGLANNIIDFQLTSVFNKDIPLKDVSVSVIEQSNSGADRETIESIRFNAPKFYQRQDRNVTTADYNAAILSNFGGWIDSITSWGGEDNIPPQYAKIFICIKPKYTEVLSPGQKEEIISWLDKKNLPCIDPIVIDPSYINVSLTLNIEWMPYKTGRDKSNITQLIDETVRNFFKTNITTFTSTFKYSKFLTELSDLDVSIDSILTEFQLKQYITTDTNISSTYTVEFLNKIKEGTLNIGPWTTSGSSDIFKMNDENGVIYLNVSSGKKEKVGTIDYSTGVVKIQNYLFGQGSPSSIAVTVEPYSQNINLSKNYLLTLDTLTININENLEQ